MSWLWPKRGIKRALAYWWHRMARLPDTAHGIAAGVAAGAAISFTPFLGLHIVLGIVVAFIIRGNYIGVVIGTMIGNPWTFPFIFALNYKIGAYFLGTEVPDDLSELPVIMLEVFYQLLGAVTGVSTNGAGHLQNTEALAQTYEALLMPLLIGSLPTTIISWIVFYLSLKALLERYHVRRHDKRMAKVATFNSEIHKEVLGDE